MPTPISTARPPRAPAIRSAGQTSAARPPRRPSRRPPTPEPNPESDSESNSESDTIPYEETTDRTLVDKPVDAATHNDMSQAWEITQYFQMCILFDAINPLRQFKRGTEFNEDDADPFPVYNPRDHADLTESDEEGILQPYKPSDYTPPRYRFKCSVTVETFLNWTAGQLQKITYGKTRKSPRKKKYTWDMKTRNIPIQYVRILHQFTLEDEHGKTDSGHESLHRRTYAQSMLDRFGQELDAYRGPEANFRSKVLSPVLQRQLRGIPDTYAPVIRRAIAPGGAEVTISRVTIFYLGNDPLDPRCIPSYRQNLVYIREALWHLGILMGRFGVRSRKYFNLSLDSHDYIMDTLKGSPRPSTRGVPPLGPMEVAMLVGQQVDSFFEKELARVPELLAELREGSADMAIFSQRYSAPAAQTTPVPGGRPEEDEPLFDDDDRSGGDGSGGDGSGDGSGGDGSGGDGSAE